MNVQGLGKVGYALAQLLVNDGAQVVASDINEDNCTRARNTLAIETVSNEALLTRVSDVFAPCALGGVINEHTIPSLKTQIVAGAANNQLLTNEDFERLHKAGILYCPDYLINAGGVVDVYHRHHEGTQADIDQGVAAIATRLRSVLADAQSQAVSPEIIARARAEALINKVPDTPITTEAA